MCSHPTQLNPPSPPSIVILSHRFRIPNKSVNLSSEIQREEDSAPTRPFTFSELEKCFKTTKKYRRNQEPDTLNNLYFYCLTCVILFGSFNCYSSLRYNKNQFCANSEHNYYLFLFKNIFLRWVTLSKNWRKENVFAPQSGLQNAKAEPRRWHSVSKNETKQNKPRQN